MKYVVASGYFAPFHEGHLDYFEGAAELGDRLFVIVNNDRQTVLKGSIQFMSASHRRRIVAALRVVTGAFISIDEDLSVSKTLEYIHGCGCAHVFANSGDVSDPSQVREYETCRRLGIEIAFLSQPKVASSGILLRQAAHFLASRPS